MFCLRTKEVVVEIVIVNFSLDGLSETDYERLCDEVAPAFAAVPGLTSKVWLADRAEGVSEGENRPRRSTREGPDRGSCGPRWARAH